jgi:hypothetical protein
LPGFEPQWAGPSDATVVLVAGCPPSAMASPALCGADYDATLGNLKTVVLPAAPQLVADPGTGFETVIQASAPLDGELAAMADASVLEDVLYGRSGPAGEKSLTPMPLAYWLAETAQFQLVWTPAPDDVLTIAPRLLDGGAVATYTQTFAEMDLETANTVSFSDGGGLAPSPGNTFVVVGDPLASPDSGAWPHALHFPMPLQWTPTSAP